MEPLTMEELVCMDGEPVWIRSDGVKGKKWYLVCAVRAEGVQLIDAHGAFHGIENVMKCNTIQRAPFETDVRSADGAKQAEEPSGDSLTIEELRELEGQYVWVAGKRWNCWGTVHCSSDHDPDPSVRTDKERDSAFNLMVQGADFYRSPPEGEPKVSRHRELCLRLNELYAKKNHDYGDSFGQTFQAWGPVAAGVRMADKLNRFVSLSKQAAEVKDESIIDTLMDLANYAIMSILELEGDE